MNEKKYIIAFDTANEYVSIGIGQLLTKTKEIKLVCSKKIEANRQSNTMLLPNLKLLIENNNINLKQIACVACGKGPGSFTGVRIALATAKGISNALEIPLIGFNTLDAIAQECKDHGIFGNLYVIADAMRKEIYPSLYNISANNIKKITNTKVIKANLAKEEAEKFLNKFKNLTICGDALNKYLDLFEWAKIANKELWNPSGTAILNHIQQLWQDEYINPFSIKEHNPAFVLPVYTRLSDAEENERKKLSLDTKKNMRTGVNGNINFINKEEYEYLPADIYDAEQIELLEAQLMDLDAWKLNAIVDDIKLNTHIWWVCKNKNLLIGYVCGFISGENLEICKIAVNKNFQHNGIAKNLISLICSDARDLCAKNIILEVRRSNVEAIDFYKKLGLKQISQRKQYYSNNEDALILQGPLYIISKDVAGMMLKTNADSSIPENQKPIILAVESSCDETAVAIISNGKIVSEAIASQIDFHKRFGGVVPEIASRKHIEAICGVVEECVEIAKSKLNNSSFSLKCLDAVAVTYAPGLVGALVVGMAYAKGIAMALGIPFIGVNHLEGHLYANKLCEEKIELPAIASIISGGNTILVHVKDWGEYKILGTTIDDAVGEAFDKVSKKLGLGYPGGPIISKLAKDGNPKAINFPRAMIHSGDYSFSLSGLKTAVINYIDKNKENENINYNDICASFQQAIVDVQAYKVKKAIEQTAAKSFMFGGGVAANPALREAFKDVCKQTNSKLIMAPLSACGDNASMIALVANERFKQNKFFDLKKDVQANASLDIKY